MPGPNVATAIAGLEAALANDALNPQPSYTLNGLTVSQTEWRTATTAQLERLYRIQNQAVPYIQRTIKRM